MRVTALKFWTKLPLIESPDATSKAPTPVTTIFCGLVKVHVCHVAIEWSAPAWVMMPDPT